MADKDERSEIIRRAGPYLGIGATFAAALAIFTYGGYRADKRFGTSPWLTLAGALIGLTVGFYNFFVIVLRNPPDQD